MSAVSYDRVDIIAPGRPHSRVGVILGGWSMKAHEVAGKLNIYSRGGRSLNQRRQNPWDTNSSRIRAQAEITKKDGSLSTDRVSGTDEALLELVSVLVVP
jgi:hypothetical protein